MAQWRVVAQLNDCPPGQAIEAVAGERVIAIYNVDGEIYALDGVCPHQAVWMAAPSRVRGMVGSLT
jgi:nitrite reductase/ring-hydroxylating ferredoxin subunit